MATKASVKPVLLSGEQMAAILQIQRQEILTHKYERGRRVPDVGGDPDNAGHHRMTAFNAIKLKIYVIL
ncbi:hypothetical protein [Serratia fonticola]|uniref:hypothetical protein n=1 Tax=Serratia fonticola TaxID=47917 RepID=UPI003AF36D22